MPPTLGSQERVGERGDTLGLPPRGLAHAISPQPKTTISAGPLRSGEAMRVKVPVMLLVVWMMGVYDVGDFAHVLLLGGVMLLPQFVKSRNAVKTAGGGCR